MIALRKGSAGFSHQSGLKPHCCAIIMNLWNKWKQTRAITLIECTTQSSLPNDFDTGVNGNQRLPGIVGNVRCAWFAETLVSQNVFRVPDIFSAVFLMWLQMFRTIISCNQCLWGSVDVSWMEGGVVKEWDVSRACPGLHAPVWLKGDSWMWVRRSTLMVQLIKQPLALCCSTQCHCVFHKQHLALHRQIWLLTGSVLDRKSVV